MRRFVHVAAAVIEDGDGRVLLARRPEGKHQGGLWEFPGGKLEPDEPVLAALGRELHEELGIIPTRAVPLIQVPHHYPDKSVLLDVYRVDAFHGEPWGREGQQVAWVAREALDGYAFPAANRPILAAALLPRRLLITGTAACAEEYRQRIGAAFAAGAEGAMLRAPGLTDEAYARLAASLLPFCRQQQRFLSLNCSLALANRLGADALHLNRHRLRELRERAQFRGRWLSASCHDADELALAAAKGVDFVTLSPLLATASHPERSGMGWARFQELVAQTALPVLALGGMDESGFSQACEAGAQGIAAIRAWWPPQ